MANKVLLKRSSTSGAGGIPSTSVLDYGELALNYADGKLYFKNSSNTIQSFDSSASDLLTKIKTVDGSGSGLDADTLDGYNIGTSGSTIPLLSGTNTWSGTNNLDGVSKLNEIRFKNSNTQKFSQIYNGGADAGTQGNTYFQGNEYQPIFTITPSGASENYQVVGRIVVQSGGNSQIIYLQAALRSNTLPDLSWTTSYTEEIIGGVRYVDPALWVNETSGEAAFTLVLNGLNVIYGTVTCDIDVIHRYNTTFGNMVMNTTNPSEVTSIPANFTSYAFTKTFNTNSSPYFGSNVIWHAGNDGASSGLDADLLDGVQGSSYATLTGTQTLTNKTLDGLVLTGSITAGGNTGANGYILTSTGSGVQWSPNTAGTLDGLSDVTITAPTAQQVLKFNGSIWQNADPDSSVASAVFATNAESDLGSVTDLVIGISEDLGLVTEVAAYIYNMGSLVVDGIVSLNNIDQSIKADYIAYSIIFGF